MDRLWAHRGSLSVREVLEELQRDRQIAYTTVMTVLDNLYKKGWLRRELDGRAYQYQPVSTRAEYSAELMREALSGSKNRSATLVHFLDQMSAADSRALRRALEKRPRRRQ